MIIIKTLFLSLFLLTTYSINTQNLKLVKKDNIFKTAGKIIKKSVLTVPNDFVYLGKEFSSDWKKTGYYTAGILGLIATDKITTRAWQNLEENIQYSLPNITPTFLKNTKNQWILGDNAYITYPIIGLYVGSLFTNEEKGQYAAINSFKAIAYSTLITQITLKTIFGRKRPHEPVNSGNAPEPYDDSVFTSNNWNFFNSRNNTYIYGGPWGSSLPSMHVTTYFALAKVIQMEYDNYWIPYGVISLAYLSNIDGHQHWFSDMVAGGILGTLIGRSIVRSSWKARGILKNKQRKITLNYIPQFSSDFTGIKIIANIE